MRKIYTFLLLLLLPFILLRLFWRSLKVPAYRQRWQERFALFDTRPAPGGVWIHAVSVGEAQAVEPLVRYLMEHHATTPIVITTTTLFVVYRTISGQKTAPDFVAKSGVQPST